ncbi:MYG1 exonuclease-like [Argopecten irradians]|uniref:MYG1 exonuclease-like n=1 Tax=Argopecten irradians TaxID=31199 RepID=UPI003713BACC
MKCLVWRVVGNRQLQLRCLFKSLCTTVKPMSGDCPAAKKARVDMKIGTHNGSFHCDEVLACFLLRQLPQYKDAQIKRTRDPAVLDTCDIVVDVGGVFDPEKNKFDHHQRSDSMFCYCLANLGRASGQVQFNKAYDMVGTEFLDRVLYYKKSWIPARELVEQAIKERTEVDQSGEIVVLKSGGCPWKDHLLSIEEELALSPKLKYVLYTDNSQKWRIQCVPLKIGSFENRLSLPEQWRGVRGAELSEKSGIPGCIFVHAGGFIGGNETYDGVLEMARRGLQQQNEN